MKAYIINDTKILMSLLLTTDCFDHFLLEEALITTFNQFHIDGRIRQSFYTKEEQEDLNLCPYEFSLWKEMKGICFQLIKGRRTPLHFKATLLLMNHENSSQAPSPMMEYQRSYSPDQISAVDFSGVKACTLTVNFDGGCITLVTGISPHTFLMDKMRENLWDDYIQHFLTQNHVGWEPV